MTVARLNLDEERRTDYRIQRLAKRTGELRQTTLGRLIDVWWLCHHRKTDVLPAADVDGAADLDGFADAMIAERLATHDDESVIIADMEHDLAYIRVQGEKAQKGGLAKSAKYGGTHQASHGLATAKPEASTGQAQAEILPLSSASPLLSSASPLHPDTEQTEPTGSLRSPALPSVGRQPRLRPAAKTPLAPDWAPNASHVTKASELRLDLADQAERFRLHHGARGSVFVDWSLAFHTWLRNAPGFAPRSTNHAQTALDRQLERVAMLTELERSGGPDQTPDPFEEIYQ